MTTQDKNIQIYFGGAIKALGNGIVEGQLIANTDEDKRDLHEEFFNETTDKHLKDYPISEGMRILYQHGLDETVGIRKIGQVIKSRIDDKGVWLRAQIDMSDDYNRMIYELVESGKMGWSSGALPQSVRVAKNGLITNWAVIEASLTPTPAMPMMTKIQTTKSLLTAQARKDASTEHKDAIADDSSNDDNDNKQEDNPMTEDEIRAIIRMVLEENSADKATDEEEIDEDEAFNSIDTSKAEDEDDEEMDDEEKAKSMMKQAASIATQVTALLETKRVKRDAMLSAARQASKAEQVRIGRNLKEQKPLGAYQGIDPNKADNRFVVGDNLKTAHLSASDMALAVMMRQAPAKSQGIPVPLGNYFDEPFYKEMAHKMHKHADTLPYTNTTRAKASGYHMDLGNRANYHIKSAIPFKADELNAAVITGQGAEWVAEWWSTDLWERERFETHYDSMVSRGMQVQVLPQGVDQAHFSTEGADPIAYVAGEARSVGSNGRPETTLNINPFATGTVSVTPTEIKIATSTTTILEEDSIINVVTNVNRQISQKALETRDQLMVNGDTQTGTTNINNDGSTPATGLSTPYYIASDGFRLVGLANGRDAENALNLAQYRLTLQQLDPELRQFYERMVFFIDPTTEMASLAITEIATDDVRRTNATVTSGRLLNVHGVDVRVNGWIPQTDADGKVTAAGNAANRGSILLAYAPYWGVAWKRQMTMETARDIYSGSNIYVMSMRLGFIERGTNAAALSYNVATAAS